MAYGCFSKIVLEKGYSDRFRGAMAHVHRMTAASIALVIYSELMMSKNYKRKHEHKHKKWLLQNTFFFINLYHRALDAHKSSFSSSTSPL